MPVMLFIAERSLWDKAAPVISKVLDWGFDIAIKWVNNILDEPHTLIDYTKDGKHWKLIFPSEGGVLFIVDYRRHRKLIQTYAGGAVGDGNKRLDRGDRATVVVYGDETAEVLELRIVHELLHCIDLPADDLNQHVGEFLPWWLRLVYKLFQLCRKSPEHMPYFQRKYYHWCLNQRKERVM